MTENKSNKEQIECENNGGVPPSEGECRNQESGDKAGSNHERLEQIRIKYEEKNQ